MYIPMLEIEPVAKANPLYWIFSDIQEQAELQTVLLP